MKKALNIAIILCAVVLTLSCVSCEKEKSTEEIMAENNYTFFDVVNFINEGNYDAAKARIDEVYGNVNYSDDSTESYNKMNLLRMYNEKQEKYNEAAEEILAYLNQSGLLKRANDEAMTSQEKTCFDVCVTSINKMFQKLDEDIQTQVLNAMEGYLDVEEGSENVD